MKIKDLPKIEWPREKLEKKGAQALHKEELLAIILRTGIKGKNVLQLAQDILSKYGDKKLIDVSFKELRNMHGVGPTKAAQVMASIELGKRLYKEKVEKEVFINSPEDVLKEVEHIRENKKENFIVLYLDARNRLVYKETVSIGILNANLIHPREVFEPAVRNLAAQVEMFGQEVNPETFAVAKSDLLIKGENADNIKYGSTLSHDQLFGEKFDYMLSNPPYGKEWKKDEKEVVKESELGFQGRFSAGLPRISDGQLLFLQTMLAKMNPSNGGSRIAIVMNGSPLFTGDAGSGESEIRRWIIKNDWLETIIALPNQLFYNTGIHTYIWVLTNRKKNHHKGKVKLINTVDLYEKMRKSLGDKRNIISDAQIQKITKLALDGEKSKIVKVFPNEFFGYRKITIERPLKHNSEVITDKKGNPEPDVDLRDYENVPLGEDIREYFKREVLPHVPDAWISEDKKYCDHKKDGEIGKIGYEISFTRYFYEYKPLRALDEISGEIKKLENEIAGMLADI